MEKLIDYQLSADAVSNPDGSREARVTGCRPTEATHVPAAVGNFKEALQFASGSSIAVSLSAADYNKQRFYARIAFKTPDTITDRQNLMETSALPMAVYLDKGISSTQMDLHVKLNNLKFGWTGVQLSFNKSLSRQTWYALELAYDYDTLAVLINGNLQDVSAFSNGALKMGTGNQLYLGSWVDGRRFSFTGKMATVQFNNDIPANVEAKLDAARSNPEWHISKKYHDLKPTLNLGSATGILQRASAHFTQQYQHGIIVHSVLGTFEMHGSIMAKYNALSSSVRNELAMLQSDEIPAAQTGSRKSLFKGGAIYWSGATGAVVVLGQLFLDYENLGESTSPIGLPVREEQRIGGGKLQLFQAGRMYYKNGFDTAKEVHGAILTRYLGLGGHTKMGFPISNEEDIKSGTRVVGKCSEFESCTIYWSGASGAFEVHGDIRRKYREIGGPLGQLGFPTSNEGVVPGDAGARYNTFQQGSIVWFGNWANTLVCYPFEIFLDRIKVRDADDDILWKDDSDIYAKVEVFDNGHCVSTSQLPRSGTYSNTTEADLNFTIPRTFIPNEVNDNISLKFQAWDSDSGRPFSGGDDNLGLYQKDLNIRNAWGLRDNNGIYNRVSGSHSLQMDWAVRPKISQGSMSDRDYFFWGVPNWGNDHSVGWDVYADAFRDISRGPNFFDHLSLRSLYYELVVKDAPKGGNCFGMSLEGIYARKCLSRFGKPLNRFTKAQIEREINIKHIYQLGAGPMWWFVGQFISGNTHDPKDVFRQSQQCAAIGDHPVICISQDYWFTQKPHCIHPFKWDTSKTPWEITCFDPNITSRETIVKVDPNRNTYSYAGSASYSGGEWSGGRFHYMPWRILNSPPRTPNWELFGILLLGSIIIFGDEAETEAITDLNGNNLDAKQVKQGDSASAKSKVFLRYPGFEPNTPHNLYLQRGQALNNNFIHKLKGKQTADFKYGLGHLNQELVVSSRMGKGELETYDVRKLGKPDNQIRIANAKSKTYDLNFSQQIGNTGDLFKLKIEKLPTAADRKLEFSVKPNQEGIDIITSGGSANTRIFTEITNNQNKVILKKEYDLTVEGGMRLRPTQLLDSNILLASQIKKINGSITKPIRIKPN